MPDTITKAGQTFVVKRQGRGRLLRRCPCAQCMRREKWEAHVRLPCLHHAHGLIVECTCPLREKHCRACGKVYLPVGMDWYEIDDPHPRSEQGKAVAEAERLPEFQHPTQPCLDATDLKEQR